MSQDGVQQWPRVSALLVLEQKTASRLAHVCGWMRLLVSVSVADLVVETMMRELDGGFARSCWHIALSGAVAVDEVRECSFAYLCHEVLCHFLLVILPRAETKLTVLVTAAQFVLARLLHLAGRVTIRPFQLRLAGARMPAETRDCEHICFVSMLQK